MIQSLKKNWLVVSNMTWGIWWIFTQPLKCLKISLWWVLFVQSMKVWAKKIQSSYLSWHWTVKQNLNKPWPCGFKNGMMNWVNFHWSTQKSENLYFDGFFMPKAHNVFARKFQRNYVSWNWRVMQNLKENWLLAWKMTRQIWLIFMRAVESLKICTLI